MKNNFVAAQVTLSADIADAGTFTVAYPAGYSVGDFENARGSYLSLNGSKLIQPKDIGLSFGAASVTVTNRTGGALAAGTRGYFQFELMGANVPVIGLSNGVHNQRVHAAEVYELFLDLGSPIAAAANSLCTTQSVVIATTPLAVINGTLLANAIGVLDVPRNVVAAWTGAAILTVTGLDEYGETVVEQSGSGTSFTGKKAFKNVISFSLSANVTGFTAGHADVLGLPIYVGDPLNVLAELEDGVITRCDLVRISFQATEAEVDAATTRYLSPGFAGYVIDAGVVLENTVTTGGALTYTVGATTIVGLTNTIADGAAAGIVYKDTPTNDGTEYFLSTDYLTRVAAAALNASCPTTEWITVRRTNGKLISGLTKDTKSTATTADVRGTFDPNTVCDGGVSFGLYLRKIEITDLGSYQYAG